MFKRILGMLVQEVPDSISVCEFECPLASYCTIDYWKTCKLRRGATLHDSMFAAAAFPARDACPDGATPIMQIRMPHKLFASIGIE